MAKFSLEKYIEQAKHNNKQILIAEQGVLIKSLDLEVCLYLEPKVKNLLRDSIVLLGSCRGLVLNDYSFLVTPAYKALEGFMIQLSTDFGVCKEEDKNHIGQLFVIFDDEENIYKQKESLVSAIKKKLGNDKDALLRWNDLARAFKSLRHSPAHFGKMIDTYDKAENYVRSILLSINGTASYLLDKGYLGEITNPDLPSNEESEDEVINQKNNARTI